MAKSFLPQHAYWITSTKEVADPYLSSCLEAVGYPISSKSEHYSGKTLIISLQGSTIQKLNISPWYHPPMCPRIPPIITIHPIIITNHPFLITSELNAKIVFKGIIDFTLKPFWKKKVFDERTIPIAQDNWFGILKLSGCWKKKWYLQAFSSVENAKISLGSVFAPFYPYGVPEEIIGKINKIDNEL